MGKKPTQRRAELRHEEPEGKTSDEHWDQADPDFAVKWFRYTPFSAEDVSSWILLLANSQKSPY